MGESTCLMQTFSHPSDSFHEPQEGNPLHALGESISFGRFLTEPLAWEKWSSFNNNRYLEEVERYSKPGSVAQKKAYFEAHYKKKLAAKKAEEAALEDENSVTDNLSQLECDIGFSDVGTMDTELLGSDCHVSMDEPIEAEVSTSEAGLSYDAKCCDSNGEVGGVESITVGVEPVMDNYVMTENNVVNDYSVPAISLNQHEGVETKITSEVESDTARSSEKLPLKEIPCANQESSAPAVRKKPSASSSKASVYNRARPVSPATRPRTPARPRTPVNPRKENNPTLSTRPVSPATRPRTPARRPRTPVNPRKENNPTLSSKKTTKDLVEKRPASASVHMSLNFTPRFGETNKIATPVQKTRNPRIAVSLSKTPKECLSFVRTPSRLQTSEREVPKLPPIIPHPDNIRTKTPFEQNVHGSRKMDVKWKSLSVDRSMSSNVFGNKSMSPSVSSSFSLRSEERAAKRKEYFQKLEEEYNAKEDQRMQLQAKSKEKAETELKKLRQNLGFKAKPMPDFYRETQLPKTPIKKIPLTCPRSPKLGRKPCPSAFHETSTLPPKMPSVKSDSSQQAAIQSTRTRTPTPYRSYRSTPKKNAHENASPNIQS